MSVVICSICSRMKDERKGLLPARERYLGSHISKVEKIAKEQKRPFFILSGVYGFVAAEEGIPYYDHLLLPNEVLALTEKIRVQLKEHAVEEIHFYTKTKPNWRPYLNALQKASKSLDIHLVIHELSEED